MILEEHEAFGSMNTVSRGTVARHIPARLLNGAIREDCICGENAGVDPVGLLHGSNLSRFKAVPSWVRLALRFLLASMSV